MNHTSVMIGGRTIEVFNENPRFINEVIVGNEYHDLFDDLVVVDLGANIGTFSLWIYDHARVIYAIEPSAQNIACLNATIEANGLTKIKPRQYGISGSGGNRAFFAESDGSQGNWHMDLHPVSSPFHTMIPTKSIKEFVDEEGLDYIDVLKIDVEGAEQEIFESVSFASIAPMIHIIIGEYHNYDPIPILQTLGFRVYVDHHHSKFTARRI